jgi:hypothetical protein
VFGTYFKPRCWIAVGVYRRGYFRSEAVWWDIPRDMQAHGFFRWFSLLRS